MRNELRFRSAPEAQVPAKKSGPIGVPPCGIGTRAKPAVAGRLGGGESAMEYVRMLPFSFL